MLVRGTAGWTGPPIVIWLRGGMSLFEAVAGVAGAEVTTAAAEELLVDASAACRR